MSMGEIVMSAERKAATQQSIDARQQAVIRKYLSKKN
jgi:hypothetical protein